MVCLFSMCSRGFEGHQNDKFFIYKACEKRRREREQDGGNMGSRNRRASSCQSEEFFFSPFNQFKDVFLRVSSSLFRVFEESFVS